MAYPLLLTRDQARALDRRAMDAFGVPGVVLMENARCSGHLGGSHHRDCSTWCGCRGRGSEGKMS
jgi:hypothetical protein